MDFLGNENKSLLWSVLQESDVFQNIPNNRFDDIRATFDKVLNNYNQNSNSSSIKQDMVSMNKEVIPILLNKINSISTSTSAVKSSHKKIEVVYRAEDMRVEDIHKKRAEEFNTKIQEQQTNMNELLQPKKPKEVSFADNKEDKPLGGDMERLIQDMLTSRERELETISATQDDINDAKKWIGTSETTEKKIPLLERRVIEGRNKEIHVLESINSQDENITDTGPSITDTGPSITDTGPSITDTGPSITDTGPSITDTGPSITDTGPSITDTRIIPPNDNDIMSKFKKKDPYREVMDELKVLKGNQGEMMTLLEKIFIMLEKNFTEE